METYVCKKAIICARTDKAILLKFFRSKTYPKAIWIPKQFLSVTPLIHGDINSTKRYGDYQINKWFFDTHIKPKGVDNKTKKEKV